MEVEENLLKLIKESKKYSNIAEEVIIEAINNFIKRNSNYNKFKEKYIVKEIKTLLHKQYGSFQIKGKYVNKREKLIEQLKENPKSFEVIEKILETNISTKERLSDYKKIYKKIIEITGEMRSITDLGAGLNPISIIYSDLNLEQLEYYSYDINEKDVALLNQFFDLEKIKGEAKLLDCSKIENIKKLHRTDVCFMFKFIDTVEKAYGKGHKLAEEIIKTLIDENKSKFIIISFSTHTLSGNKMNFPYRGWIERLLDRIKISFSKFETQREVFYIIKK